MKWKVFIQTFWGKHERTIKSQWCSFWNRLFSGLHNSKFILIKTFQNSYKDINHEVWSVLDLSLSLSQAKRKIPESYFSLSLATIQSEFFENKPKPEWTVKMNTCLLETHLIKPLITLIMTFLIAYIWVYCPEMNRKIILILRFVFCQRILWNLWTINTDMNQLRRR